MRLYDILFIKPSIRYYLYLYCIYVIMFLYLCALDLGLKYLGATLVVLTPSANKKTGEITPVSKYSP